MGREVPNASFVTNRRPRMEAPENNAISNFERDDIVVAARLKNFPEDQIQTLFPVLPQPIQDTDYDVQLWKGVQQLTPITVPLHREEFEEKTPEILTWHTESWELPAPDFNVGREFVPLLFNLDYTFVNWNDANWDGYANNNLLIDFDGITQSVEGVLRQEYHDFLWRIQPANNKEVRLIPPYNDQIYGGTLTGSDAYLISAGHHHETPTGQDLWVNGYMFHIKDWIEQKTSERVHGIIADTITGGY